MKTNRLRPFLALFALCSALGLQAQNLSAGPTFGEVAVTQVAARNCVNGDTVTTGTSRVLVSLRLGSPEGVLPDGSWLYSDYILRLRPEDVGQPATLVVRFTDNKVAHLWLADQMTVVALRRTPRAPAGDTIIAAADRRR